MVSRGVWDQGEDGITGDDGVRGEDEDRGRMGTWERMVSYEPTFRQDGGVVTDE